MTFDPEWKGPIGYKSKKKRVMPDRRHWYRGWWHSLAQAPVTIQFTEREVTKLTRKELLARAYNRI